jgi:hypothetical protein
MVDRQELRIGNFVGTPFGNVCKVLEIYENKFLVGYESGKKDVAEYSSRMYVPILITPEVFKKFGFKKHKNSNKHWIFWWLKNGWHIAQWIGDDSPGGFERKGLCYWGDGFIPVEHLHQLQNIYFALTQKELIVINGL